MKRKQLNINTNLRYRIYSSANEFVVVEAGTASEAFRKSGVKQAYHIVKETEIAELSNVDVVMGVNLSTIEETEMDYSLENTETKRLEDKFISSAEEKRDFVEMSFYEVSELNKNKG